jgi:hypothetical protein
MASYIDAIFLRITRCFDNVSQSAPQAERHVSRFAQAMAQGS